MANHTFGTWRRRGVEGPSIAALSLMMLVGCGDDERAPTGGGTPTLGQMIAAAAAGDTVRVAAGTHAVDATISITAAQDGLVVLGRAAALGEDARPVIDAALGGGSVFVIESGAEDVEIRGLEIAGSFGTGVRVVGTGATVADCWIEGASLYSVSLSTPANGLITRNILLDAGVYGVQCNFETSPHILQNTIVGAGDCGIITSSASPFIERNLIYDSANFGIACFGSGESLPAMSCNVIDMSATSNYSVACTPGADDIEADPELCGDGTYAVSDTSPCLPQKGGCGWIGAVESVCGPPPSRASRGG